MKEKIGVQIFTVRDYLNNEEEIRQSLKKIKDIGYDYIQTAGTPNIPYETFAKITKDVGLEICGTHESFKKMQEDFEESLKIHEVLDTKIMGIGGCGFEGSDKTWRTWGFHSDEQISETIKKINMVSQKLAPLGYKFTYHNHGHEFVKFGNKTVLQHIIDGTDPNTVSICLDIYWAQYGGVDVRQTIKDLKGRIDIIHLKDMGRNEKEPFMACIGEGNFYWKGIIDEARNSGVRYFVVEQDDCQGRDPFECLEKSYKYLRNIF